MIIIIIIIIIVVVVILAFIKHHFSMFTAGAYNSPGL